MIEMQFPETRAPLVPARRRYAVKEITLWRKRLPKVRFAVLPSSTFRPNPVVIQDCLFVSVFSPGAVFAIKRSSGEVQWRRRLVPLGGGGGPLCQFDPFREDIAHFIRVGPGEREGDLEVLPIRNRS